MQRQTSLRIAGALALCAALLVSLSPAEAGNSKNSKKTKNTVAKRKQVVLVAVTNGNRIAPGVTFNLNAGGTQNLNSGGQVLTAGTITLSGGNRLQGATVDQFSAQGVAGPILGVTTSELSFGSANWADSSPYLSISGHILSSNAGLDGFSMGMEIFPSSVPAGGPVLASKVIIGADTNAQPVLNQVGARPTSGFQAIGVRPDFKYQPEKLKFEPLTTTDIKGQPGMNVAPAIPQGTSRYVPLGEF